MEHILHGSRVLSAVRNAFASAYERVASIAERIDPVWVVGIASAAYGVWGSAYIQHLGLTTAFLDQNAHLNLSRQAVDSMTPGASQLGFWPPLLHIILIPFVAVPWLYETGLAGAFALVPMLALGSIFFYKLLNLYTERKIVSMIGALAFAANPYVLYYAATPMMEVLFFAMFVGAVYFFSKWMSAGAFRDLLSAGIMTAFAGLARFEGLFLVPVMLMIMLYELLSQKKKYHEIEALVVLFASVAFLGAFFIFMYGYVYAGDPLAFMRGEWSASAQQQDYFLPAKGSVIQSVRFLFAASFYMLGKWTVFLGVGSFFMLMFGLRGRGRVLVAGLALLLLVPFFVNWLSLYQGNTVIYLPDHPPYEDFFNERYGLFIIAFAIAMPVLLAYLLIAMIRGGILVEFFAKGIGIALLGALVSFSASHASGVIGKEQYAVVKNSAQEYPTQIELAKALRKNYDRGNILITRALHDFTMVRAGVPLKNYIQESNYGYFEQALDKPWLFARWVVMINRSNAGYTGNQLSNEEISRRWGGENEEFLTYYELVYKNDGSILYRMKEDAVRVYASERGMPESAIPSLAERSMAWDLNTFSEVREF